MGSHPPLTEIQVGRIGAAHETARRAIINVLTALEPVAEGTPGLPDQLDRIRKATDRFEAAVDTFIKRLTQSD